MIITDIQISIQRSSSGLLTTTQLVATAEFHWRRLYWTKNQQKKSREKKTVKTAKNQQKRLKKKKTSLIVCARIGGDHRFSLNRPRIAGCVGTLTHSSWTTLCFILEWKYDFLQHDDVADDDDDDAAVGTLTHSLSSWTTLQYFLLEQNMKISCKMMCLRFKV